MSEVEFNKSTEADGTIRLAKRVAEMVPCSRAEADKYIAGGWVLVDGAVVERTAEELEEVPIPVAPLTAADQLRADVDYLAMIMEVNL
mgnify:CR=1 FL=1